MNDTLLFLFIINLFMVFLTGGLLAVIPYITSQSPLFGVRIPANQAKHPQVISLKRRFRMVISFASLVVAGLVVVQYMYVPQMSILTAIYAPLIIILMQFVVYIPSWKRALLIKAEHQWALSEKGSADMKLTMSRQTFSQLPWAWYIVSAVLAIVAIIVGLYLYPTLPDQIATHWGASMEADSWSEKSLMSVLAMPLFALGMAIFMMVSNMMTWRMKLQLNQEDPARSYAQHRIYRRYLSHVLGAITVLMTFMFLFFYGLALELWSPSKTLMYIAMGVPTVLMIVLPLGLSLKVGQAGNKINPDILEVDRASVGLIPQASSRPSVSRQDDRYWKLGMFYYNKEDPTLFVEDRFGTNGGFNYARPFAWVFVALIFLLTVGTVILTTFLYLNSNI
ncbi:MAG TPA: DUF1648 domain-containing protein [Clostridiaceae bacterium]|nr:DUF1648 domain-containing protein [Clostridiaceae bacterium]